jgi:hypothetical protein
MVNILLIHLKGNNANDNKEQGWEGYHSELSTDPTFRYGLLVSYYVSHNHLLQQTYRKSRW